MGKNGVSILTRGDSLKEELKSFLLTLGFGSSRGPLALENNLSKGLKLIDADFSFNPSAEKLSQNICLLRSIDSADQVKNLTDKTIVAGPNLKAEDLATLFKSGFKIKSYLAPSKEVKFAYVDYGIPENKIVVWPVGIDTEVYADFSHHSKSTDCLLYFKNRKQEELKEVEELLRNFKQSYRIISYGSYKESELIQAVKDCRYAVILDSTESQGIAVESIMSANLSLFVFDQIYLGHPEKTFINENLTVTSVPYWDDSCGVKVPTDTFGKSKNSYTAIPEAEEKFKDFLGKLSTFKPREYILKNLTLEKQAREFVEIFSR